MDKRLLEKVYEKIPEMVAEMAAWETAEDKWLQTVYHFTKWSAEGELYQKDALDDIGLRNIIRQAKRVGASVSASEDGMSVTIRRDLHDGEYFISNIVCVPTERKCHESNFCK